MHNICNISININESTKKSCMKHALLFKLNYFPYLQSFYKTLSALLSFNSYWIAFYLLFCQWTVMWCLLSLFFILKVIFFWSKTLSSLYSGMAHLNKYICIVKVNSYKNKPWMPIWKTSNKCTKYSDRITISCNKTLNTCKLQKFAFFVNTVF